MKVHELRTMLERANPDAIIFASDIYDEGEFAITGMLFSEANVILTGENND